MRGAWLFMEAFNELSSCRQIGFGLGPIPWRDTLLYAYHAGIAPDMVSTFLLCIREMDEAFLRWQMSQPKPRPATPPEPERTTADDVHG